MPVKNADSALEKNIATRFDDYPVCPDADLWTYYTPQATTFKLWSPVAEEAVVKLYEKGEGGMPLEVYSFEQKNGGLWEIEVPYNLSGIYYTYQVKTEGRWLEETPGIYARAVGVNGKRAMVIDLAATNPPGWENDRGPLVEHPNDIILYELHIRDLTIHPHSGSSHPGKYAGLTEKGTRNRDGLATGFDHIRELGVTHIHLLPAFDYCSVDESKPGEPQYNWGYDPQNYNVPEGSYATDPFNAEVRVKEFKQMVKAVHDEGLGVIMDVVYNHTGFTDEADFNLEVPGYYYRQTNDGNWSDASGCGNETASERAMVRKFIIESCKHWVREYHIDGFRFDLMAIHDIETMNLLTEELKKINPSIVVYGEGWTAGGSPLPDSHKALKANTKKLKQVAAFSDDLRDAVKGSVFDEKSRGFVSGATGVEEKIKFGVAGCTDHPQLDFGWINFSQGGWAAEPWQSVSYVSCHDNHTLYDKLKLSCKGAREEEIKKMHMLANGIVLTSQGIPFLHAGVELMRSKGGEHNSYNLPDSVNRIDWNLKTKNRDVFTWYKELIALRKAHPAFRMPDAGLLARHLVFTVTEAGLVGFQLKDHANGDSWKNILVFYNARKKAVRVPAKGEWSVAVKGDRISPEGFEKVQDETEIPPLSMLMLFQEQVL